MDMTRGKWKRTDCDDGLEMSGEDDHVDNSEH